MSKGSKQRPMQISESQMQDNWDLIFSRHNKVLIWPDGTWCHLEDSYMMNDMSDDYKVADLTDAEYTSLLEGNLDPQGLL